MTGENTDEKTCEPRMHEFPQVYLRQELYLQHLRALRAGSSEKTDDSAGSNKKTDDSAGSNKKTDDNKDGRLTLEPAQGFTSSTDEDWKAKMNVEMDECFEARWSIGPSGWLLTFEPVRGVTLDAARAKWLEPGPSGQRSSWPFQLLCKTCKGTGLTELEEEGLRVLLEPEKGDAGTGSGKAHEGKGSGGGKAHEGKGTGSGGGSRSRSPVRMALQGATYREQV
jgi:hypothetical protein